MSISEILKGNWKMLRLMDLDLGKEFEIFTDENAGKKGKVYHVIYDNEFKTYPVKSKLRDSLAYKKIRLLETKFK